MDTNEAPRTRQSLVEEDFAAQYAGEWASLRDAVRSLLAIVGIAEKDDVIELARGCLKSDKIEDVEKYMDGPLDYTMVDYGKMVEEVENDARADIDEYQSAIGSGRSAMRLGDKLVLRSFFRHVIERETRYRQELESAIAIDKAQVRQALDHRTKRRRGAAVANLDDPATTTMMSPSGVAVVIPTLTREPLPVQEMMYRFEAVVSKFFNADKRGPKFKLATRNWVLNQDFFLEFKTSETRVSGFVPVYRCTEPCNKTVNCYMQPDGHNVNTSNLVVHFMQRRAKDFDPQHTSCRKARKSYLDQVEAHGQLPHGEMVHGEIAGADVAQ
mmetsp:Transcript_50064/g.122967  ORF Transcript_50064/g.122967 Transcript_50064/m.122967 type:complete len:327 (-) Transcript_50064:1054-2034(-)